MALHTQPSWESDESAYERGMNSAVAKSREREGMAARAFADKILSLLQPGTTLPANITNRDDRSTPGTWPRFMRAVEHIVSDLDPANAATPHGVFNTGNTFAANLASAWSDDAMRATNYATLIEQDQPGIPQLPVMSTPPTAGPGTGEKNEAYSVAFDITNDDAAVTIDSTLYLNVSNYIETFGGLSIVQALMSAAVANEASSQIVQAITDAGASGTDMGGAFGSFDQGRFTPRVVVVPPSALFTIDATTLAAANVEIVIDPNATAILVCDPAATVGYFKRLHMESIEPQTFGRGVAFAIYGRVSVDPAGVAVVTGA